MPKLQAGCTLTAQDGMVIRTAATSEKAAEGQEATLEFILVNHPLDCPVCDKGGECPLQDLTFRYGPGRTRMHFPKLTFDKPIPVSPLIALDRERCILCYRCTRFSEEVSEDGLLVPRNRGAHTVIATFEDEPYRSPFSGNVIELCPVGALTSTLYRFEGRPWDIQNVPTVCTGCPVGCNVSATIREGKVKRILSRNHPEIDRGWLCDKGRFTYPHLRARDRITTPLRRGRDGLREVELGRGARRGRGDAARGRQRGRDRALGIGDDGDRLFARAGPARRARRPLRGPHGGDLRRARRVPAPAVGDRGRGARGRGRRRPGRRAGADRRPLDQGGRPARAPTSSPARRAGTSPPHRRGRRHSARSSPGPGTRSGSDSGRRSARSSSGRARAAGAAPGSPSSRTPSGSTRSPAAAPSISPPPPTDAVSPPPGRSPPTPTRRTPSRSASSSSRATRPQPTRASARWRRRPSTSSC